MISRLTHGKDQKIVIILYALFIMMFAAYALQKKHLKRHNEIPKGTVFILESMYTEQPDIRLTKK